MRENTLKQATQNLPEMVKVSGVDVYFIGAGDLSRSMGYAGQPAHPEVQKVMERRAPRRI